MCQLHLCGVSALPRASARCRAAIAPPVGTGCEVGSGARLFDCGRVGAAGWSGGRRPYVVFTLPPYSWVEREAGRRGCTSNAFILPRFVAGRRRSTAPTRSQMRRAPTARTRPPAWPRPRACCVLRARGWKGVAFLLAKAELPRPAQAGRAHPQLALLQGQQITLLTCIGSTHRPAGLVRLVHSGRWLQLCLLRKTSLLRA